MTNLSDWRQIKIQREIARLLASEEWVDQEVVVRDVRESLTWAMEPEVLTAVDQLWEDGRLDSRKADKVKRWEVVGVAQIKLLAE